MHLKLCILLLAISSISVQAQRIDGSFAFQSDPDKKYSLFIPDDYDAGKSYPLVLGLHPLNTSRWDAESWCDTLTDFSRANNIILVCPDGGADGRVDDAIDTAFTSALLDSVNLWYNIDKRRCYAMGFSWGGKTTYSYAMSRPARFNGFMPIGAAVTGAAEVSSALAQAAQKPVYIIHGSQDAPSIRYTPIKAQLEERQAIVKGLLMEGVGHTIDFSERNKRLSEAYKWIDSVNLSLLTGFREPNTSAMRLYYESGQLHILLSEEHSGTFQCQLVDTQGRTVYQQPHTLDAGRLALPIELSMSTGTYILRLANGKHQYSKQFRLE